MGFSILEMVVQRLRQAGFQTSRAYPGQKYPQLSDMAATVHIAQVDRANLTVTLEVSIICPAAMGGTACEVEALRATEVLRWSGAVCVQNGCSYDGVAQVYIVTVLATYTGVTEAEDYTLWPGFHCYIGNQIQRFAIGFTEEYTNGGQAEYGMGQSGPVKISLGRDVWKIQLEELIPCGSPESEEPDGEFELRILTDQKQELYSGCRWIRVQRQFSKQGLRRIREGLALGKQEE